MKKNRWMAMLLGLALTLTACGGSGDEASTSDASSEAPAATSEESSAASEAEAPESGDTDLSQFKGKTLKVSGLDGGYGVEGWNKVIAKFEEKTGATVESNFVKNIYEVVRPEIQAGNPPDVLYNSIGQESALTETMIKEGMLTDITDVMDMKVPGEDVTVREKLIPGYLDNSYTSPYGDGKIYLAPLFHSPTGLWYNEAMFKDGGGKYDLPTTMDEFLALGETAKADGVSLFTYPTSGYFDSFIPALISNVGGPDLYNKLMAYDAEAWEKDATPIFETTGKILQYVNPNTVAQANNESFTQNQLSVMENKSLFMPNGTWIVGEMAAVEGAPKDFKWNFMPVPAMEEGGDRYVYSYFEQIFIPKDAAEPELAKAFLAYLYSDEATQIFLENGGAVQPVTTAEAMITDPDQKMFYSIYNNGAKAVAGGFEAAPAVEGVSITDSLYSAVDSVANGELTVQDWQKGVVDAAKQISAAVAAQ